MLTPSVDLNHDFLVNCSSAAFSRQLVVAPARMRTPEAISAQRLILNIRSFLFLQPTPLSGALLVRCLLWVKGGLKLLQRCSHNLACTVYA